MEDVWIGGKVPLYVYMYPDSTDGNTYIELEITAGHQPFSDQILKMTNPKCFESVI